MKDEFYIQIPDLNLQGAINSITLRIYDITGKLNISPTPLSSPFAATGNNVLSFKIPRLENGFYFYELMSDREIVFRGKFIAAR